MSGAEIFDGGQFAQIGKTLRKIMVPFIYLAIKSVYRSKGKTLKKIMWCDDDTIKPYFTEAGRNITYGNLKRQLQSPCFCGFAEKIKKSQKKLEALEQFSLSHAIYSRGLNTEAIGGDADGQAKRPERFSCGAAW